MSANKKIRLSSELMFVLGMLLMPFAVTLCTKANLGMSMIAAPTYIISEKTPLSYGQTEYIFQALVLILMCALVGKAKPIYLTSFISAVVYGSVLDFYIWLLRGFEANALALRIVLLIAGMVLTSLAVAMLMHTYLPPCAYDYLVREVVEQRHLPLKKTKLANDFIYLVLSVSLTLILFHGFVGVSWGTLIMAVFNGYIISFFSKFIDKNITVFTRFSKLEKIFK